MDEEGAREDWTPTPKQYEAYLKREVELARHNLTRLVRMRPGYVPSSEDLLVSTRTYLLAMGKG